MSKMNDILKLMRIIVSLPFRIGWWFLGIGNDAAGFPFEEGYGDDFWFNKTK